MAYYRVIKGRHLEFQDGSQGDRRVSKIYDTGEIVESAVDLCEAFNQVDEQGVPRSIKFERVDSVGRPLAKRKVKPKVSQQQQQSEPASDGLDGLTIEELRKFAAEEEVDLGDAKKKEDIIEAIRETVQIG